MPFIFLLMANDLALAESFKVRSPWKIGGMSTRWDPLSPKFLIHSLILVHHVLNLGEGNLTLDGEAMGTLELGTNTLMRFPLLKAKDATIVGGARVERCPSMPWSNQIGGQISEDCRPEFQNHLENVLEDGK